MRISLLLVACFMFVIALPIHADALSQLDNKAKANQIEQQKQDKQRTQNIKQARVELEQQLSALKRSIQEIEKETEKLSTTFSRNEKALVD